MPSSSSLVDIGENGASGTVPSSLAPLPTPSASPPPLPGPLGETPEIKPNDGDLSNGSVVNRIEPSESGMDRGTERVLISVSSIGMAPSHVDCQNGRSNLYRRCFHHCMLHSLDDLAAGKGEEEAWPGEG